MQRVWRAAVDIAADLVDRPPSDQAKILNDVIETCVSREVRLLLREESYVQRERFVAVRWAFEEMREKWWTAHNWLELRLKKFVPNGVYVFGHKLFSKLQDADGIWQRQVFLPIPTPVWRARQDNIFTPLWVESPFRNPPEIAAAQEICAERFPLRGFSGRGGNHFRSDRSRGCLPAHSIPQKQFADSSSGVAVAFAVAV